ncbi:Rsm22-domain-containing protein [Apiospora arundinis]|uniref:Rsm22-domain-containing protein n=1 Tax=Apiospora arundinis TaxID=335852 RepID=A0ABR2HTF5_9PEZI
MLAARKAQKACPRCRAQLLNLFEHGFATTSIQPQQPAAWRLSKTRQAIGPATYTRGFAFTRSLAQDAHEDSNKSTSPEVPVESTEQFDEIELVVRQAKAQFGDTLPRDYLNEAELKLYTRLYGPPLRETRPEDVGMPIEKTFLSEAHGEYVYEPTKHTLLRETEDGVVESIEYHVPPPPEEEILASEAQVSTETGAEDATIPSDIGIDYIKAVAKNKREFDALMKLQKDFERASLQPAPEEDPLEEQQDPLEEEEFPEEEEEDIEEEDEGEPDAEFDPDFDPDARVHPYTKVNQWRGNPSTVHLPKNGLVKPIAALLARTDLTHVQAAAERVYGGSGLPDSVATPQSGRSKGQKAIPVEAGHHRMSEIDADTFMATNLPGMYASVMSILVDLRKRMGREWMHGLFSRGDGEGPRVLDVGAAGAGLVAFERVLRTEWELLHGTEGKAAMGPPSKKTVIVGSDHLRHRISRFLHNTTFLPRLPDYLHSGVNAGEMSDTQIPQPRKCYDVIIASHQLMPTKEGHKRRAFIDNLWEMLSPEGGILIIVEKGHPRGFEAVADVRQRLLDDFIEAPTSDPQPEIEHPHESRRTREPGMIIAPCTTHKKCPMYLEPGTAHGRKDFCRFSQRFIRPPFLQRVLGANHRNHEDVDFSFVAIQRGITATSPAPAQPPPQGRDDTDAAFAGYENAEAAPNPFTLPRSVMPPLKRHGHVTLDLCTPSGTIERWTVPKSYSKQAYHDARKARWGDLWALGAKTRVVRPVRLGKGGVATGDGGVRDRRAQAAGTMKGKQRVINLDADSGGIYKASEGGATSLMGGKGAVQGVRRTKGGKKLRSRRIGDLLKDID